MQRDTCALMFFPVREIARRHAQLPPLPRVDRAGCSPCAGAAARGRGVAPLPPLLVLPGNTCCAGSFDAWLMDTEQAGGECFLLHAFSHEVLPCFSFLLVSRRLHPRPRWPNR